jgi:hypothetical protein
MISFFPNGFPLVIIGTTTTPRVTFLAIRWYLPYNNLHIDIYIQMDQEQTILMIVGDLIMCRGDLTFAVSINL